jgi:hypothetical protein
VSWPVDDARHAIVALAEAGFVILGLDELGYEPRALGERLSAAFTA